MRFPSIPLTAILAAAGIAAPACGDEDLAGPSYDPDIPTEWASAITNPYFPLVPGTTYKYENQTDEGLETTTVEVLRDTKLINGVTATVVHDRVSLDGELIEDTFDWYAQDPDGNVWYLGEDTKELEDGQVVSTEGSWVWGVEGGLPGIVMWADPAAHVGEAYRQEYYEVEDEDEPGDVDRPGDEEDDDDAGEENEVAGDWGKVVAVDQSVTVRYGTFTGCVKTEDWNPREPGILENKYYCPQLGVALEAVVQGGDERVELVDVTRP